MVHNLKFCHIPFNDEKDQTKELIAVCMGSLGFIRTGHMTEGRGLKLTSEGFLSCDYAGKGPATQGLKEAKNTIKSTANI